MTNTPAASSTRRAHSPLRGGHGVKAARQVGALAGVPSVVDAWRLQPTRRRVWLCRPSPLTRRTDGQATATHGPRSAAEET